MNNDFGLQEDFDIELKKSIDTNHLEFKGVCEVVHKREGNILSIDKGANVITNAGKVELVRLMGSVGGSTFHWIALGRKGDIPASATDKLLGGASSAGITTDAQMTQAISNNDNYYVSTDLATPYGFEYNREFVLDRVAPSAGSKTTRDANTKLDKTKVQTEADGNLNSNYYHEINTNTFAGDTLLWHSKFKFIGITADGSGPAYTGNATAIINEAGIFNKSHTDSGNTDPIEDVIMLARRTFSEKPVKIDDELTIKWQITIK